MCSQRKSEEMEYLGRSMFSFPNRRIRNRWKGRNPLGVKRAGLLVPHFKGQTYNVGSHRQDILLHITHSSTGLGSVCTGNGQQLN